MLEGCKKGDRVVVAMSGGVDSSVVAALCHEHGYEVVGITLQLYDAGESLSGGGKSCCGVRDIEDARRVALKLGIGHYVLDYESRFREGVIDDFVDSYLRGETPIPCVRGNQEVKFADLLSFSKELGAKALVTGHYVRRERGKEGVELHRAVDEVKDQSYFLFATTKDQLEYCRFPLGGMEKKETRALALERGLGVAQKRDSQNICFVPDGDYAKVVRRHREQSGLEGAMVDEEGRVLGRHRGIECYTVGQRRGLGLGAVTDTESLYVIRIDVEKNEVVVGPRESLAVQEVVLRDMHWFLEGKRGGFGEVKVRSSMKAVACEYAWDKDFLRVRLDCPQYGVARGQAGVLYEGERVLGGGWIT